MGSATGLRRSARAASSPAESTTPQRKNYREKIQYSSPKFEAYRLTETKLEVS